jgi:DNA-binding NtrC family response regulator
MKKRTILVVDDDSMVIFTLSEYLKQKGYEVLTANGIKSCVKVFKTRAGKIDLSMIDVHLKSESGFALADILEAEFRFFRYVFMTAFFWEEKTLEELLRRGKPYFEKPLRFEEEILPFLKDYFKKETSIAAG